VQRNAWTGICLALVVIGAINWGLVGFFNFNLINLIFGGTVHPGAGLVSRIIYAVVGLAGLAMIVYSPRLAEHGEPMHRHTRTHVNP